MSARSALAAMLCLTVLAGCTGRPDLPTPGSTGGSSRPQVTQAPTTTYDVVKERFALDTEEYQLEGLLFYPKSTAGSFPVVIFGHGLRSLPDNYEALLRTWAAAGFVVAAPVLPQTNAAVKKIDPSSILGQEQYLSVLLDNLGSIDARHALAPIVDVDRAAVAGHSGGGVAALDIFSDEGQQGRDERFDAGIILAGAIGEQEQTFPGKPASLLFVHAQQDPVIPYDSARSAYQAIAWPKAFLTLPGGQHSSPFTSAEDKQFPLVAEVTLEFLRWRLYFDASARERLAAKVALEN